MNVLKTLRTHWKKSIFFTVVGIYGLKYAQEWQRDSHLRQLYCKEAQKYGEQSLPATYRPRKVVLFLNPAAQKGKARKLFEKNVAPILNLAGIEVNVVRTEYEGQAKKMMEVLDETDSIIVAGGDGTLGEVITGLLRRSDQEQMCQIPIGVIPLGSTNTLAGSLVHKGESSVRWMGELAMAIIKETTRSIDVMQVTSGDKTVYAVGTLEWSLYQDAANRKQSYWFLGPLKHWFTYIMTTLNYWPPTVKAELAFSPVCEGCSKCYERPMQQIKKRWWFPFVQQKPVVEEPTAIKNLTPLRPGPGKTFRKRIYSAMPQQSKVVNTECGALYSDEVATSEIIVSTCNIHTRPEQNFLGLRLSVAPNDSSKVHFIEEGWRRENGQRDEKDYKNYYVSSVKLMPNFPQGQEAWFTIDSERFEAKPIEIKYLRQKLKVFCPRNFYA